MPDVMTEGQDQIAKSQLRDLVFLFRPQQWIKNVVVLAGLVFGGVSVDGEDVRAVGLAFLAFCLASSSIYILNDLNDREQDRVHPTKRDRPLASGRVSERTARILGGLSGLMALFCAWLVNPWVLLVILSYLGLMGAYTLRLKQMPFVDVGVIAAGFELRAIAGAAAVEVPISPWLLLCTFLLSLFLGFAKRRNEMLVLGGAAVVHRPALRGYSQRILDQLIGFAAGSSIVVYAVYTVVSTTAPRDSAMELSVPWVAIAILRYCFLVYRKNLGGAPETLILRDKWLFLSVLAWGISVVAILRFT